MKKQIVQFLLGILYIGIVTALLLSQVIAIGEQTKRLMTVVEILLLVIPLVVILGLYIQVKNRPEKTDDNETVENSNGKTEHDTIEGVMEQFGKWCDQYELSEREAEVAWLLYRGYTNRQIAEELYIAETTVKKHASHIYEKTGVSGKKELKEKFRRLIGVR